MSEPIISVSGLRGTIGDQLTPLVAARYAAALAATLPKGTVVIGRDGRSSGSMLAAVVSATLQAHGLDVADLGPASTPTVGVQVRALKAVGGIQISASHNPKEYNGLKLFGSDGRVLSKHLGENVLSGYRNNAHRWVNVDNLGKPVHVADPHAVHLGKVLDTVDVDLIRSKKFRVVLDSNHGAGGILGARLLQELGCDFTVLGLEPNGQFWHKPEPLAENLVEVANRVRHEKADVCFCQDPDADRLAVIDENGHFIGEELTLALCLLQSLPSIKTAGYVVTNCATSSVSKFVAEKFGHKLLQSAVGEANVADCMIANAAVFGGEGNGGPIDPAVGYVRDSFVGMARILCLLAQTGQTVSQHVASLPPLAMVKDKVTLDGSELPRLFEKLIAGMPGAQVSRMDGLKLEWPDRWLLVRGSNTEPIVRFIAEAPTTELARQLCDAGIKLTK
ncbi:MAG: phosphoglucosamine mutase [Pirellulales bacterium]